jgi:hypothetical protein
VRAPATARDDLGTRSPDRQRSPPAGLVSILASSACQPPSSYASLTGFSVANSPTRAASRNVKVATGNRLPAFAPRESLVAAVLGDMGATEDYSAGSSGHEHRLASASRPLMRIMAKLRVDGRRRYIGKTRSDPRAPPVPARGATRRTGRAGPSYRVFPKRGELRRAFTARTPCAQHEALAIHRENPKRSGVPELAFMAGRRSLGRTEAKT